MMMCSDLLPRILLPYDYAMVKPLPRLTYAGRVILILTLLSLRRFPFGLSPRGMRPLEWQQTQGLELVMRALVTGLR